ncbi:MAG: hypothetical protein HKO53_07640 [Gemmatimonadetes bacterium]|nr:hypothetical protein [Gemmatimonadota bacterium]
MYRNLLAFLVALWPVGSLAGPDDVVLRTSMLRITEVQLADRTVEVDFLRTTAQLDFGFGGSTLGVLLQNATKPAGAAHGRVETGVMLTAGHDWILSDTWRLDLATRVGLKETDPKNPLYATDTDLSANLVRYSPDGAWLWARRPVHPSAYVGGIVNRYGRVQLVGAAGLWWRGWGTYLTGFTSLNGDEDPPMQGTEDGFGYLKNQGLTASASYDLGDMSLSVRRHFATGSGGNDLAVTVQWHHEFGEVLR